MNLRFCWNSNFSLRIESETPGNARRCDSFMAVTRERLLIACSRMPLWMHSHSVSFGRNMPRGHESDGFQILIANFPFRTIQQTRRRRSPVFLADSAKIFKESWDETRWFLTAMCSWRPTTEKFRASRCICTTTQTRTPSTVLGIRTSTESSVKFRPSWAFLTRCHRPTKEDSSHLVFIVVGSCFKLSITAQRVRSQCSTSVPPRAFATWTRIAFISTCSRRM